MMMRKIDGHTATECCQFVVVALADFWSRGWGHQSVVFIHLSQGVQLWLSWVQVPIDGGHPRLSVPKGDISASCVKLGSTLGSPKGKNTIQVFKREGLRLKMWDCGSIGFTHLSNNLYPYRLFTLINILWFVFPPRLPDFL